MILGCAFFHDVLKPCASLSQALQAEDINIVDSIEAVLMTNKRTEQLKSTQFSERHMAIKRHEKRAAQYHFSIMPFLVIAFQPLLITSFHSRVFSSPFSLFNSEKGDVSNIRDLPRGTTCQNDEAVSYFTSAKDHIIEAIMACLKDRVTIHHPQLLKDCLTLLATNGWQRSTSDNFADHALDNLPLKFSVPLENAGVDTSLVCVEWKDMLEYAKQYLNLMQEPSEVIWWKLFNASWSSQWSNVLCLVQLLYCIPMD